ncbi:hypothetical protein [Methylotuvimicrobium buryatense]|uniref:DUF2281 domain-containing protein n=1 Tax=Methylotuvimicrobium buryatense TaxID=95641 RepID=A0A4P9UR47_METBY|nr:hypothetical protein [Methylotuvimicrobium buryatense]QCW82106.1 hypothetical protein EQU24_07495 [Methylotuvimicrobium buryatense]
MLQTIEVRIDDDGHVFPLKSSEKLPVGYALLTLLEPINYESALLSEQALSEDWLKPEEDEAWAHLQPVK